MREKSEQGDPPYGAQGAAGDRYRSTNEELSPKPQRPRGGVTLLEKNEKKRRILRLKIVQNAPK
jgi:hypothetical protein